MTFLCGVNIRMCIAFTYVMLLIVFQLLSCYSVTTSAVKSLDASAKSLDSSAKYFGCVGEIFLDASAKSLEASAKYFGHVGEILGLVEKIFWNRRRGFGCLGDILNYNDL